MAGELSREMAIVLQMSATNIEVITRAAQYIEQLQKLSGGKISQDLTIQSEGLVQAIDKVKKLEKEGKDTQKAWEDIDRKLKQFSSTFSNIGKTDLASTAKDIDKVEGEVKDVNIQLEKEKKLLDEIQKNVERLERVQSGGVSGAAAKNMERAAKKAAEKLGITPKEGEEGVAGKYLPGLQDAALEQYRVVKSLESGNKELAASEEDIQRAQEASKKVKEAIAHTDEQRKKTTQDVAQALTKEAKETGKAAATENKLEKETKDVNKELTQEQQLLEKLVKSLNKLDAKLESTGKKQEQKSKGVTGAIRGLTQRRGGFVGALAFATGRLGYYSLAASIIYSIFRAIRAAGTAAVEFGQVLAEIQGVLPSKSQLEAFQIGESAIQNAAKYGVSLKEAAESAKLFAQTGLNAAQVADALNASLLAVRGANLQLSQARDLIIAVENITRGEVKALDILDRISRVESRRAVTASDLAYAIQRIGPLVSQLKGDMTGLVDEFDIAMGAVTTIVERTRVSGVNAATSLRFVLSRFARPEIVRQVQQITGVGFARAGGKELRPFAEVLQEVSAAYQNLIATGRSGRAFELLGAIGGARQLQATAALLENFSRDTLQTARISSLAFNDALERAGIGLDTINAKLQIVGTAWANVANAFINSPIIGTIVKGGLDAISTGLTLLADGIKEVNDDWVDLINLVENRSRYSIEFVDVHNLDVEQIPRLKAFIDTAQQAGLSSEQLVDRISAVAEEISQDIVSKTGLGLNELQKQLDDVATGNKFRTFYETYGEILSEDLSDILEKTVPNFKELKEAIEQATDPAIKAELRTQRLAAAYELLGEAVYATNAVIETNNERIREGARILVEDFSTELEKSIRTVEPINVFEAVPGTGATGFGGLQEVKDLPGVVWKRTMENMNEDLQFLARSFIGVKGATEAWAEAVGSAEARVGGFIDAGKALDIYTRDYLRNIENTTAVTEGFEARLKELLISRGLPVPEEWYRERSGGEFLGFVIDGLRSAAQRLIETNELSSEAGRLLRAIDAILSSPGARSAQFLKNIRTGVVNVRQKLLELLATFVITIDSIETLSAAYDKIGIAFDRQTETFTATKTLFTGLSKVQNQLRKDIILTNEQLSIFGTAFEELAYTAGKAVGMTGEDASEMLSGMFEGIEPQSIDRARAKLGDLQDQLRALEDVNLANIFGNTPEGQAFLRILDNFLRVNIGSSAEEALATFYLLREAIQEVLKVETDRLVARDKAIAQLERENTLIAQQVSILTEARDTEVDAYKQAIELRTSLADKVLSLDRTEAGLIENKVRKEAELYSLEKRRITANARLERDATQAALENTLERIRVQRSEGLLGDREAIAETNKAELDARQKIKQSIIDEGKALRELDILFQNQTRTIIFENLIDKFVTLENQIKNNISSATSGLQQVLTSFEDISNRPFEKILGSIGQTFIDRTAENFVQELVNAQTEGLIGRLIRLYAETPETRMRENLQHALELAGTDIAAKFIAAGEGFNDRLAMILGVTEAPLEGTSKEITDATRSTEKATNNLSKEIKLLNQAATLAAGLGGTAIGGGGPAAQVGAQFGATAGRVAGEAIGTTILPGVGTVVGGALGGIIGGLFDKDKTRKDTVQALNKIEQNTRETVDVLELERKLLDVTRGAINVPSTFNLPQFTPTSRGGAIIQQSNTITAQITISSPDGKNVVETIRQEFGPMIREELNKIGV